MRHTRTGLALAVALAVACAGERTEDMRVEVMRIAPPQTLADSLEVTPSLDTAHNTPEQGRIALSIEVHVKNIGGSTRQVPAIGFRAVPEQGRDTTAPWRFDITRRTVDSLRPGEGATFGLTTSPASVATDPGVDAVYRIEALFGDSMQRARALPLGRIRLRPQAH
jgi:hypothetical protein